MITFHLYPPVTVQSAPIIGAATEAKQDSQIAILNTLATQTTLAALLTELELKADLSETQPVSAASLPLPTGASTEATLAALLTELQLKADLTETQPVSAASLPLPAGAATEATLELVRTLLAAQEPALSVVDFTRVNFSATNVTDLTDLTIVASSGAYRAARFFYAGGQPIFLKLGAVNEMIIPPGADFEIKLDIPALSEINLRAVVASTTINTGQLIINWLG
jgi:hypothetical protein